MSSAVPGPAALLAQYRQQLHDDFSFFLKEVWRAQSMTPARVQYDIARWLQSGPSRRGVIGWRGMAKTWITAAYICWRLYRQPELKVLLVSAAEETCKKTLRQVRKWIERLPFLTHLTPDKSCIDNTGAFEVAGCEKPGSRIDRIASVSAMGLTGALPGNRANLIVCDDIEQDQNTITLKNREALRDWVTEFESILSPGGDILYLGTYHHPDSLYDALQTTTIDRVFTPYKFRNWPVLYPAADEQTSILAPMLHTDMAEDRARPGDPVWPERFDRSWVQTLVMGKTRFQQQFMGYQDNASQRFPLKLADFIVHPVNPLRAPVMIQWGQSTSRGTTACDDIPSPGFYGDRLYSPIMVADEWIPYAGNRAFLDPAGAGEDEMTVAAGGQLHGYIFVKGLLAVQGGPTEDNFAKIATFLKGHHCTELAVEPNFAGTAFITLLEAAVNRIAIRPGNNEEFPTGWSCAVAPAAWAKGQKEVRIINSLEPGLTHHRIVLDPAVAKDMTLLKQIVFLNNEPGALEHDDRVEALAGLVAQFSDTLGQNAQTQTERLNDARRKAKLDQYYKDHNIPQPSRTWSGLQPA